VVFFPEVFFTRINQRFIAGFVALHKQAGGFIHCKQVIVFVDNQIESSLPQK
jgi:hypothetical protein